MAIRYGRFEMPKTLVKDESTATDTYAKFTAEPFEAGYGHTVGNSVRRVLLSSLEGAAITAAKITGAQHEFATLPGVVEDVTDIVLNHAGQRGELVLRAGDFYRGNGRAFERGKQNAPEGVPNGVTIAGLKWLGGEFCISICGRALVFDESLRHFKTTVTDWHNLIADFGQRIADGFFFPVSGIYFPVFLSPGSPWRVRPRIQRRRPRDQRRNFKNSLRSRNKDDPGDFASGIDSIASQ